MAIIFLDSIQDYTTSTDLDTQSSNYVRNSALTLETTGGGAFGGNNLHSSGTGITNAAIDLLTTYSTVHFSSYIKYDTLPNSGDILLQALTIGGSGVSLRIGTNQKIIARDWNNNNDLATESGTSGYLAGKTGTWVHFEVKWVLSTGGGVVEVWLDGNHIISYAGSTGASSTAIQRIILSGASGRESDWDQIVIWDETGTGFAPSQLGNISGSFVGHKIATIYPTANGATNQFSQSGTSPNYTNVDEVYGGTGSDYNFASSANLTELYSYGTLSAGTRQILTVQELQYTAIRFASDTWNAVCRSGSTNYNAATGHTSSTSSAIQYWDQWYVNPDTSAQWTDTEVNAAQFGVKITIANADMRLHAVKLMVLMAGVSAPPGSTGTWGSTEAKDTFHAESIVTGTMGATEAKDVMAFAGHIPAATPVFVSNGAIKNQSIGTTIQPALPAGLVNGNVLIAFVGNGATTGQVFTFPAGWTPGDAGANGNLGFGWAWRVVDGSETDPIITWPTSTSAQAQIWQFSGVATIGAANHTVDTTGFTTGVAAAALTTTAANSLVFLIEYNNNGRFLSPSPPTDYTEIANVGPISSYTQGVTTLGDHSTAVSTTLNSAARTLTAGLELCSSLPPIFAAWASTEAKDVWASRGSLIGGSWHSTEAKDIASMSGFVPLAFAIGLTEHPDIMNFAVFEPPFGTLGATEAKDVFAFSGQPTPPLSLDAHASGGSGNNSTASFTSATVAITTAFTHEIIILAIHTGGFWVQGDVTSVSDTAGLFWQKRNKRQVIANHLNGTFDSYVEEWWAHKPTAGATTITVNTNTTGAIAIEAVAIAGANVNAPFDTHTGAAKITDNYSGNVIDPDGRGHFGNPAMLVYTDSAKTMTLAFHASPDVQADTSVATGFTFIDRTAFAEHNGNTLNLASMYRLENAQQFGTTDVWFGPDGTHISNRYLIVDSIVAADQTASTNDQIRWFFDGTGNRTIEQFGTGQNSTSMNVVTFREESLMVVAVMSLTGANSRVDHISDDANTSGWTRRSIVTDSSGAVCMEVWWVKMADAFSGNVTVNMDAQIQNGDFVSAIAFAIQGADAFLRGEIWDHNGSLPATAHGTTGLQTVGPFNTSNDNVLVLAFGANIDTTPNDTDPTGKNVLPFLQLPAPGELVSDGPPSFHIALDYKFSGDVVAAAHADIDVSPSPQSWLMIADAIPVGPVSPPHGSWISQEARDTFTHVGDFTAIGIAPTQGWVGFPPASASVATSEAPDTTSNSGAFTAIWRMDEGWIAYVPAFMAWADTEHDDTYHNGGWILGPTTILARMDTTEARDLLGFSSPFTFYTTRYSTGDRTSLITVTTNATLDAGTIDNLVDGVKANGAANAVTFHATQPGPVQILFDFGIPMLVSEATMYQNGPFAQPGLWHWRASNDLSAWDILTDDAILNSGNIGTVVGSWPTNTTLYRYYELIQTTNAGMADIPQIWEMEFKVGGTGAAWASTESKDRFSGNMLAIPTATPIPARKRRLLIVT